MARRPLPVEGGEPPPSTVQQDGTGSSGVVQLRVRRPCDAFKSVSNLEFPMAKPHRNLKKANHGARPANSKARKAKRKHIRT